MCNFNTTQVFFITCTFNSCLIWGNCSTFDSNTILLYGFCCLNCHFVIRLVSVWQTKVKIFNVKIQVRSNQLKKRKIRTNVWSDQYCPINMEVFGQILLYLKVHVIIHQSTNMRCLHLSLRWIYWVFVAYIHGYQKGQENISLHCFHPIIIHYMMNQWSFKI